MKIAQIIKKDIKLLLRSRTSSLIIIFGPLLVMFLVGIAFDNSNQYSITLGVHSDEYTELTNSFITKLTENKFNIKKIDSIEDCKDRVKTGGIHACINFPPGLKIGDNVQKEVTFHVDYSRINLAYTVIDVLSTELSAKSDEISKDLTQDLLQKIANARTKISETIPKVSTSITNQEEISGQIIIIEASINNITLAISNITDANDNIIEVLEDLKEDEVFEDIDDKLSDVKSDLNGLEDEEDRTAAKALVDDIQDLVNTLESDISNSSIDISRINSSILLINQNIDTLKTGITGDLSSKISDSIYGLQGVKDTLNQIHADIGTLRVTDADDITKPITTKIEPVVSEKTHLNYIFSGLLALVIMFISIMLSTTIVMMEKTSPSYFRNFITPTKDFIFIISTYLTTLIVVLTQIVIIMAISMLFFTQTGFNNIGNVALIVLITTIVFTSIGMLIGHLFSSQETGLIAAISASSLMLLLSNILLPIESMPLYIRQIAAYNPMVISESLLKKAILFQSTIQPMLNEIYALLIYIGSLFIIIIITQKLAKKHLVHKLIYRAKHRKAKDMPGVLKLIKMSEQSLKENKNEEAYKLYMEAHALYNDLRENKHNKAPKVYEELNELYKKFNDKK